MMNPRRLAALVVCAASLISASCGPQAAAGRGVAEPFLTPPSALEPVALAAGERLRVVATTSILADVVARVGGDRVEIRQLVPLGVDPHAFEPTPQDARSLAEADVIFINGFGLEGFMATLLRDVESVPVISASLGIEPLPFEGEHDGTEPQTRGEPSAHAADPHTWFDPNNVIRWTENIEMALATLDPDDAPGYAARAAAYRRELATLDDDIRQAVSAIPADRRKLVTDHDELGYFAGEYGFTIVGAVIPGASSLADPSAEAMAELLDRVRSEGVPAVFVSSVVNPSLIETFARDAGIRVVRLYGHSLTPPDGEAPSYLALMRYNAEAIAAALTP